MNMKISVFIPLFVDDPHKDKNPYVSVLTDAIMRKHPEVSFTFGYETFWTDRLFSFDILHIMWPEIFLVPKVIGRFPELDDRLKEYRTRGGKIVATCHNLRPHVLWDEGSDKVYDIIYRNCIQIYHMGQYSASVLAKDYPYASHMMLEHPIYDEKYPQCPDRLSSLKRLRLDSSKHYVLCMGAFRNDDERNLVVDLAQKIESEGYCILAPNFLPPKKWMIKHPIELLKWMKVKASVRSLKFDIVCNFVSDKLLPYYYGAADVAFIHRLKILNSGNLPMALYMNKVVVGPDTGNVGPLIKETGNFCFNPKSIDSVVNAVSEGMAKYNNCKVHYDLSVWTTSTIAEKQFDYYTLLCAQK